MSDAFLLPRDSIGGRIVTTIIETRFLAIGPIAGGMILGPVSLHVQVGGAADTIVRFGLGTGDEADEFGLQRTVGPLGFYEPPTVPPGGPSFIFGAGGGQHSVTFPWGVRTQHSRSWIIFAYTVSAAVPGSCVLAVGLTGLVLEGTAIVGPVSGFRRRSTDRGS